ncbi:MAG: LuxR family transcriptional regulator, partial [Gammaproteobacteria bacterium]
MNKIIQPDVQDLIEETRTATSVEEIHNICSRLTHRFGFDQFMYGSRIPTSFVRPQVIIISGYDKDWWDHYTAQNYMAIDPIVEYGANHILPLQWHDLDAIHHNNKFVRRMMNESIEFGLKSGMSFPVHTTRGEAALLSFASNQAPENNTKHMQYVTPHLMYFACHLHEAVMRIFRTSQDIEAIDLTAREKECLLWAAEGKTSDETAGILNISESTVRFH